jgi:hypothetical protein
MVYKNVPVYKICTYRHVNWVSAHSLLTFGFVFLKGNVSQIRLSALDRPCKMFYKKHSNRHYLQKITTFWASNVHFAIGNIF